jgi:hypothetical protein
VCVWGGLNPGSVLGSPFKNPCDLDTVHQSHHVTPFVSGTMMVTVAPEVQPFIPRHTTYSALIIEQSVHHGFDVSQPLRQC